MESPVFLTKSQVLFIHQDLVEAFGGSHGLRDEGLLDSALEMPKSGFGGVYFHKTYYEMAAAYLFHLVKNHPFIDGNKRIGLACADVFLEMNDLELTITEDQAYTFTMRVATEAIEKSEIALFFQQNCRASEST